MDTIHSTAVKYLAAKSWNLICFFRLKNKFDKQIKWNQGWKKERKKESDMMMKIIEWCNAVYSGCKGKMKGCPMQKEFKRSFERIHSRNKRIFLSNFAQELFFYNFLIPWRSFWMFISLRKKGGSRDYSANGPCEWFVVNNYHEISSSKVGKGESRPVQTMAG